MVEIAFYMATVIVFVADRLSKQLALTYLTDQSVVVIEKFFSLELVFNSGISFGLFSREGGTHWMLTAVVAIVAALLIIIWRMTSRANFWSQFGYGLIIGGAVGNFYDRVFYNSVIDFFSFSFGSYTFPTFNIADAAITIGFAIIAAELLLEDEL